MASPVIDANDTGAVDDMSEPSGPRRSAVSAPQSGSGEAPNDTPNGFDGPQIDEPKILPPLPGDGANDTGGEGDADANNDVGAVADNDAPKPIDNGMCLTIVGTGPLRVDAASKGVCMEDGVGGMEKLGANGAESVRSSDGPIDDESDVCCCSSDDC